MSDNKSPSPKARALRRATTARIAFSIIALLVIVTMIIAAFR